MGEGQTYRPLCMHWIITRPKSPSGLFDIEIATLSGNLGQSTSFEDKGEWEILLDSRHRPLPEPSELRPWTDTYTFRHEYTLRVP